jgi:tetratricopeptide (TPR) repeat protein
MLSSTESELKAKATKYFQEFRMDEAIDYYNRALKQANSDTCVLNSNISACYFEKGEYQTCIDYSKKVLDDAAVALNPKILEKNKARISKCETLLKDNCKDQTGINESDWLEKINLVISSLETIFLTPI